MKYAFLHSYPGIVAGDAGRGGWAWIFIIEGLITVIAGVMSFWIVQDFPDTARFLSSSEREIVIRRLQADDQFSARGETLKWKNVKKSILDYKTWLSAMSLTGLSLFPPGCVGI